MFFASKRPSTLETSVSVSEYRRVGGLSRVLAGLGGRSGRGGHCAAALPLQRGDEIMAEQARLSRVASPLTSRVDRRTDKRRMPC